jgi:hypothetical protein
MTDLTIFVKTLSGDLLPIDLPDEYSKRFGYALRQSICRTYYPDVNPNQISLFRPFPKRAGFTYNLSPTKPGDTLCMFVREPTNVRLENGSFGSFGSFKYAFIENDIMKVSFVYHVVEKRYSYRSYQSFSAFKSSKSSNVELFVSVEKMLAHLQQIGMISEQNVTDFNHIWWVYH